jgi:hypothetical protein
MILERSILWQAAFVLKFRPEDPDAFVRHFLHLEEEKENWETVAAWRRVLLAIDDLRRAEAESL